MHINHAIRDILKSKVTIHFPKTLLNALAMDDIDASGILIYVFCYHSAQMEKNTSFFCTKAKSTIVSETGVSSSTVGNQLRVLQNKGWLVRGRSMIKNIEVEGSQRYAREEIAKTYLCIPKKYKELILNSGEVCSKSNLELGSSEQHSQLKIFDAKHQGTIEGQLDEIQARLTPISRDLIDYARKRCDPGLLRYLNDSGLRDSDIEFLYSTLHESDLDEVRRQADAVIQDLFASPKEVNFIRSLVRKKFSDTNSIVLEKRTNYLVWLFEKKYPYNPSKAENSFHYFRSLLSKFKTSALIDKRLDEKPEHYTALPQHLLNHIEKTNDVSIGRSNKRLQ